MAKRVSEQEKEKMWQLYQTYQSIEKVAKLTHRNRGTVSRYVNEYQAAVRAAGYIMNASKS